MAKKKLRQVKTYLHNAILLDGVIPEVGKSAFAVYVIIALYADWYTGWSHVGYAKIRELTGIKDNRTVRRCVEKLKENGLITYEFRRAKDRNGYEYGRLRYFYQLVYPAKSEYFKSHNSAPITP